MQKQQIMHHDDPSPRNVVVTETKRNNGEQPVTAPKLTFVTPKLTKQGTVESLTASSMGTFSP